MIAQTSYTAGQFAPGYIDDAGMNVIAVDAYDWVNRIGDQSANPEGQSELYEGVIAHELEHLLHNYSDAGELSWVDEGLADFAIFLNGYDIGRSHLSNHQVLHRETSLTRWAGGLANYGAAFTYFLYLWEQPVLTAPATTTEPRRGSGPTTRTSSTTAPPVTCSSSSSSRTRPTAWSGSRGRSTSSTPRPARTCARPRRCSGTGRSRSTRTPTPEASSTCGTSTSGAKGKKG